MHIKLHKATLILLLLGCTILSADDKEDQERKVKGSGLGFSLSSGQSIFFSQSFQPLETKHGYYTVGFHIEEKGIGVWYYDPYLGRYERTSKQVYYLEFGYGRRRLCFQDKMAGEFLPHSSFEVGASAYIKRVGRLVEFFKGASLVWDPYVQVGFGASIFTGQAIYRVEMGYLGTLSEWIDYLPEDLFPGYEGAFLKMIISSGRKRR
jgi:hypothetical protein